ncbi:alpha/beta-hydrolase [Wallemia mellicola]|uniref:Alpha/beta-hydrolase n=1 Tax=Wallemia mellicola TaxID=1708541 RepID=A0A4T0QTB2_9BASI|nr:alpha/beta-hydrolase [Wallemia mellicola]
MQLKDAVDYPTIFNPDTRISRGLCTVTANKLNPIESHQLYYELHGSTDKDAEKIIFIMGLNGSCFGWSKQVNNLAPSRKYQILAFDNRAVGHSTGPRGPYSTSGMAEDVIALLDLLGWTGSRSLHLVGVSMGGMISLELCDRIHDRIASLTLAVTSRGYGPYWNLPSWKGIYTLLSFFTMKDGEELVQSYLELVFPLKWLDEIREGDGLKRTNRECEREHMIERAKYSKKQDPFGAISQMYAALGHKVSPDRMKKIDQNIPKISIVSGDEDYLVDISCSVDLQKHLPSATYTIFNDTGHGLISQRPFKFNKLVEETIAEAVKKVGRA